MHTPLLVEALLEGLVLHDEACDAYPDLGALRSRAQGEDGSPLLPLQWALCVADLPLARRLIRLAARSLLDLVDAADAGWRSGLTSGCPLWETLVAAPPWLLRPDPPDDDEPDIALLLERDESYRGDWNGLIEALHDAGTHRWQWAIVRCRAMQRFERGHRIDLRGLLAVPDHAVPPGASITADRGDETDIDACRPADDRPQGDHDEAPADPCSVRRAAHPASVREATDSRANDRE